MSKQNEQIQIDQEKQAFWDNFAEDYMAIQKESQIPLTTEIAEFLQQQQILPTDKLLDLGGGAGRFIPVFSPQVQNLEEVDISQEMLNYGQQIAEANHFKNIQFKKLPWSQLRGQEARANVVFANMFEEIQRIEDIIALNQLATNWVVLGHFTKRQSSLDQLLQKKINLYPEPNNYDQHWMQIWQALLKAKQINFKVKKFQFQTLEIVSKALLQADLETTLPHTQKTQISGLLEQLYQKKPTLEDRIDYDYQLLYWSCI